MSNNCKTYLRLTPMHTAIEQPLLVYQYPILTVELCSVKSSGVCGDMKFSGVLWSLGLPWCYEVSGV